MGIGLRTIPAGRVAEYLPKVPRGSVYKLAQRGGFPGQKVRRHWRFRRETLERWRANADVSTVHGIDGSHL